MKLPPVCRKFLLAAVLMLSMTAGCLTQAAPGEVDLSFDPGSGIDGPVNAMVIQPDGKILVGGTFTTVMGLARINVARLLPDGSGDTTFQGVGPVNERGVPPLATVNSLALQGDGKILVGHYLGISRLNADGTFDTSFATTIGQWWEEERTVRTIAVQPDGRVLIGGSISAVNGILLRLGLARLNPDGSLDRSFEVTEVTGTAWSFCLLSDGRVLATTSMSLVRLNSNGSLDTTFSPDPEVAAGASATVQPDGKLLVVGHHRSGTEYGMLRLNPDGSLDASFTPSLPSYEGSPYIASWVSQPDGKVIISGAFSHIDGQARARIARLNANGSLDANFNPGSGPNSVPFALALQPDGRLLIAGDFTTVAGTIRTPLARLQPDGSLDTGFNPGAEIDERVLAITPQPDGKVLIAGGFRHVGGQPRPALARLDADGSLDTAFKPPFNFGYVRSATLQRDGMVVVVGSLNAPGVLRFGDTSIARLKADGSLDTSFKMNLDPLVPTAPCPPGYWACERTIQLAGVWPQFDGTLILSGYSVTIAQRDWANDYFTDAFLVRVGADGTLDSQFALDARISGEAASHVLVQPDGRLLVTGRFTVEGNQREIIRIHADGRLDPTFETQVPLLLLNGHSMALQADGKLVIGGRFQMPPDLGSYTLARLNADGSRDAAFVPYRGSSNDSVYALAVQPDGKVLVGGTLYAITNQIASTVVRFDAHGQLDPGFNPPHKELGLIATIALQPDGHVLIGGDFTMVNGEVRPHLARLVGDSPMPRLELALGSGSAVLSWPSAAANVRLEESTGLGPPSRWATIPQPLQIDGDRAHVTVPAVAPQRFFRLSSP